MTDLTTIILLVVVVIVVAALAVVAATMLRRRHSEKLREQFGPEYDRTVRDADDPRAAEKELEQRRKRHRALRLRDLEPGERDGYRQRWTQVQQGFVDDPATAVRDADRLVAEIMSARGYPIEDVDRQAEDLSVRYPVVTQRYREARAISREHAAGRAGTEDLRHAVTSYRSLVEALLEDDDADRGPDRAGTPDRGGAGGTHDRGEAHGRDDAHGRAGSDGSGNGARRRDGSAMHATPPQQADDSRRETRT
ncbi:hypothetical protein H7X46_10690 [Pseudonocardia sp. C8]|uniref:hypothetical protein n=1 Tax=Pseudonocardia sp. C8 TaxID=2762759 RepID=UPI00164351F8|nr:hypothetical protein [Pseudonocardia sp. C8]MBC3191529.1 hypothetical protein [Pseudonocardia sp. C8]